ncbi:transcriptional regulator family: bZIP [Paecilomyces variotii]|nr:transcriptional regulator family: bZIP [Paecilomyces variotii]KAJ9192778.1 transcriptional regulator family: bZIP [Paecilomyces variotii]KAJ9274862.1 transcriptional regulator family: bZIP [Paecilomyces variotii]KAJ9287449.1 transcriptional regulator family: bZIP [Paecilomyces variotii]KAJ9300506.1 transcriptional regulator family: bZIP [Paecilomyces variotii]
MIIESRRLETRYSCRDAYAPASRRIERSSSQTDTLRVPGYTRAVCSRDKSLATIPLPGSPAQGTGPDWLRPEAPDTPATGDADWLRGRAARFGAHTAGKLTRPGRTNEHLTASPSWRPRLARADSLVYLPETDTIAPPRTTFESLLPITTPSESPVPGSLNFSIAPRSSSSLSTSTIPFDFQSFTTDNSLQTWLPTPPPPQPQAHPNSNSNNSSNNNNRLPEDFVLYPPVPASRPPARLSDARAPAPSNTALKASPFNIPLVPSSRRLSLNLHQQQQPLSGSPVQVPRVSRLITQSPGFTTSNSYRFSPSSRKHPLHRRFYAASVPSNSPQPTRPPVPLFYSTRNPSSNQKPQSQHRRVMSASNIAQDLPELFDLSTNTFGTEFESGPESTMFSPQQFINGGFVVGNDPLGCQPTGTVSPKDLMMDASAPPSTSFTDMSTPSFESPGYFSHDTSPMFPADPELAPGHEEWESLFPSNDGFAALDELSIPVALPSKPAPPAEPMIRKSSSPGQSPAPRTPSTKHSTTAGIRKREKPLPALKYDTNDPVAVKRARNTEAARKSRARKLERQEEMERRIAELEKSLEEAHQREEYWKALAQAAQ